MRSPVYFDRKMITSNAALERRFVREMIDATYAALRSKRGVSTADCTSAAPATVVEADLVAAGDEISVD